MSIHREVAQIKQAIEELEQAMAEQKEADLYQEPFRLVLASAHPCCECGCIIATGEKPVSAHLPLMVGSFFSNQLINWCESCWTSHYAFMGPVEDFTVQETPR